MENDFIIKELLNIDNWVRYQGMYNITGSSQKLVYSFNVTEDRLVGHVYNRPYNSDKILDINIILNDDKPQHIEIKKLFNKICERQPKEFSIKR